MPETASDPRRVLLIEDHPLFCEAMRMALSAELDVEEVHTAASLGAGIETLDAIGEVEAVLLDLNLPDVTGLDGLLRLKAAHPRAPVVVVSALADNRIIANVLAAGAAGFIPKDSSRDVLVQAIRDVLDGDVYTPPSFEPPVPEEGQSSVDESAIARLAQLTPQQHKILDLVCQGRLNKQIAHELSIAETTVKAHITAILRKLHVQSRTQAVLVANKATYADILKS
ncbi:MAG: response regulator transcription factor [Neomegalonema sp.]|nr:response regulator transcription factor [Neomegalonema sp.]